MQEEANIQPNPTTQLAFNHQQVLKEIHDIARSMYPIPRLLPDDYTILTTFKPHLFQPIRHSEYVGSMWTYQTASTCLLWLGHVPPSPSLIADTYNITLELYFCSSVQQAKQLLVAAHPRRTFIVLQENFIDGFYPIYLHTQNAAKLFLNTNFSNQALADQYIEVQQNFTLNKILPILQNQTDYFYFSIIDSVFLSQPQIHQIKKNVLNTVVSVSVSVNVNGSGGCNENIDHDKDKEMQEINTKNVYTQNLRQLAYYFKDKFYFMKTFYDHCITVLVQYSFNKLQTKFISSYRSIYPMSKLVNFLIEHSADPYVAPYVACLLFRLFYSKGELKQQKQKQKQKQKYKRPTFYIPKSQKTKIIYVIEYCQKLQAKQQNFLLRAQGAGKKILLTKFPQARKQTKRQKQQRTLTKIYLTFCRKDLFDQWLPYNHISPQKVVLNPLNLYQVQSITKVEGELTEIKLNYSNPYHTQHRVPMMQELMHDSSYWFRLQKMFTRFYTQPSAEVTTICPHFGSDIINIYGSSFRSPGIRLLAKCQFPHLRSLNLQCQNLNATSMKLLKAIDLPLLQDLRLNGNDIGDEGLIHLAHWHCYQHLLILNLGSIKITPKGYKTFLRNVHAPAITSFSISYNYMPEYVLYETMVANWKLQGFTKEDNSYKYFKHKQWLQAKIWHKFVGIRNCHL